MKLSIDVFGRRFVFAMRKIERVRGITNRVQRADGSTAGYVFFADYDNIREEVLMEEAEMLAKELLGHVLVLRSSEKNYHAVCFNVYPSQHMIEQLLESTSASRKHARMWLRVPERAHVLRLSSKDGGAKQMPRVVRFFWDYNPDFGISRAHSLLYMRIAEKQGSIAARWLKALRARSELVGGEKVQVVEYERPRY